MAGKREGKHDVMAVPRDVNKVPHAVLVLAKVDASGNVTGYYYPELTNEDETTGTARIRVDTA